MQIGDLLVAAAHRGDEHLQVAHHREQVGAAVGDGRHGLRQQADRVVDGLRVRCEGVGAGRDDRRGRTWISVTLWTDCLGDVGQGVLDVVPLHRNGSAGQGDRRCAPASGRMCRRGQREGASGDEALGDDCRTDVLGQVDVAVDAQDHRDVEHAARCVRWCRPDTEDGHLVTGVDAGGGFDVCGDPVVTGAACTVIHQTAATATRTTAQTAAARSCVYVRTRSSPTLAIGVGHQGVDERLEIDHRHQVGGERGEERSGGHRFAERHREVPQSGMAGDSGFLIFQHCENRLSFVSAGVIWALFPRIVAGSVAPVNERR